ncbi:SAG family member [Eimeria maxima]|uniref:SAG family member n=1 Tax=Eimeria maxima TaxID=5804 RepID=U6M5B2_EIMMA|nr:SAG family member [Eimeria maxima]CDJ59211.1 SAG family member [Eimeria maxima]
MRRFCFTVLAGTAAAVPTLFTEASPRGGNAFSAVDCSEQMNKERKPMGFPNFTVLDTDTATPGQIGVDPTQLCASIKAGTDPGIWLAEAEVDVTIAAAIQSSTVGDCAAATKQWKGALKTIGDSLPPAYTPGKGIYESLDVVSLMNLYTPKDGVAVACTVIQCPQKSPSTEGGGTATGNGNSNSGGGNNSGATSSPGTPGADGSQGTQSGAGQDSPGTGQQGSEHSPAPSVVTAGVGGGVAIPAAIGEGRGGGVRGGMTVRRLDGEGTQEEPFNADVCLFHPKTLTKDTPPFQ